MWTLPAVALWLPSSTQIWSLTSDSLWLTQSAPVATSELPCPIDILAVGILPIRILPIFPVVKPSCMLQLKNACSIRVGNACLVVLQPTASSCHDIISGHIRHVFAV